MLVGGGNVSKRVHISLTLFDCRGIFLFFQPHRRQKISRGTPRRGVKLDRGGKILKLSLFFLRNDMRQAHRRDAKGQTFLGDHSLRGSAALL